LPNLASARRTMDGLLLARIDDGHVHFVARDDIELSGLHAAGVLQTSGLIRSLQVGVIAIVSAAFGAWSSSMIGISTPSQRLARFEPALAQDQILLMTDVPRARRGSRGAPAGPAPQGPSGRRQTRHCGVPLSAVSLPATGRHRTNAAATA
jgi:hypothetical protein